MRTLKTYIIIALVAVFAYGNLFSQGGSLINTVVALNGYVFNEITKAPVKVSIDVFDENSKKVNSIKSNSADGSYYVTGMKPGKKYTLKIYSDISATDQYMKEKYDFAVPETKNYTEFSHDFLVKPLVKEAKIRLAVSPFYLGKSSLRNGAENFIDNMKNALKDNKAVKIVIDCYPDNSSDKADNAKLTKERSENLKEYFVKNGIDASRIKIKSNSDVDTTNPPPSGKAAKGKKYIGPTYIVVKEYK